jgi:hypothetical protein
LKQHKSCDVVTDRCTGSFSSWLALLARNASIRGAAGWVDSR